MNSSILAPKALGSLIIGYRKHIKYCRGCSTSVIHCPWLPKATLAALEKAQLILYTEYPRTHLQAHEYHNILSILCIYISVCQTANRTWVGGLAFPVINSNFFPLKGKKSPKPIKTSCYYTVMCTSSTWLNIANLQMKFDISFTKLTAREARKIVPLNPVCFR